MKNIKKIIASFTLMTSLVTVSNATLELQLTQGVSGAIPVTVFPFVGQDMLSSPEQTQTVISSDLENSGFFKVEDGRKYSSAPVDPYKTDTESWRRQLVDNLVFGKVSSAGFGKVKIDAYVVSTVGHDKVLLNQSFTVSKDQVRRLDHHISDLIYQALTGKKGVFSTRLAYVVVKNVNGVPGEFRLEVSDVDGYNAKAVLVSHQPVMSPSWSPDGKHLAYVSFENHVAQIYTMNVENGDRQLVSSFPGINGAPAWSPDGKKLAIVLSKMINPNIYVMDLQSKSLHQITNNTAINTEPNWSPDGSSLIFTSDRGGAPQIYRQKLSGGVSPVGSTERITFQGDYNARASHTQDGKAIIMLHRSEGRYNIARQDLPSGVLTVLTRTDRNESPTVAPNGELILYATQYGNKRVLSVVSTDGRVQLRLPAREGDVQEPAWGPFNS